MVKLTDFLTNPSPLSRQPIKLYSWQDRASCSTGKAILCDSNTPAQQSVSQVDSSLSRQSDTQSPSPGYMAMHQIQYMYMVVAITVRWPFSTSHLLSKTQVCEHTCQSVNHISLSKGLDVKSPTAQDMFRPIPGLISCTGVTRRWAWTAN